VAVVILAVGGAIDQARFGLFLRKGVENEQLVSEKWVNAAHQSSSSNENYGYMWWINKSEACETPSLWLVLEGIHIS
jgi:hypothetical protein